MFLMDKNLQSLITRSEITTTTDKVGVSNIPDLIKVESNAHHLKWY